MLPFLRASVSPFHAFLRADCALVSFLFASTARFSLSFFLPPTLFSFFCRLALMPVPTSLSTLLFLHHPPHSTPTTSPFLVSLFLWHDTSDTQARAPRSMVSCPPPPFPLDFNPYCASLSAPATHPPPPPLCVSCPLLHLVLRARHLLLCFLLFRPCRRPLVSFVCGLGVCRADGGPQNNANPLLASSPPLLSFFSFFVVRLAGV